MIDHIFEDFRQGRKEPHDYVTSDGKKAIKVPIFNADGYFIGFLSYSHPVGSPTWERTI
jgi:hypothetical protein